MTEEQSRISTFNKIHKKRTKKQLTFLVIGALVLVALLIVSYSVVYPKITNVKSALTTVSDNDKKTGLKTGVMPDHVLIPRLNVDEKIYDDGEPGPLSQEALLKGAGFFDESTNKAGSGNCVIFGHSAVTEEHSAPFGAIGDGLLKVGDEIILTGEGQKKYTYSVTEIKEIASTDFSYIGPIGVDDTPVLTIITCIGPDYPKDKRIIVRAELKK